MKNIYVAPMLLGPQDPGEDDVDFRPSMAGEDITPVPLDEIVDENP